MIMGNYEICGKDVSDIIGYAVCSVRRILETHGLLFKKLQFYPFQV
jgi:hypothetical protein